MFTYLSQRLYSLASGKLVLYFGLGFLFFEMLFGYFGGQIEATSQGASVLDLQFGYSEATAYSDILDKYSPEALALYKKVEFLDLIFPLVYGAFFAFLLSMGFVKLLPADNKWRLLNMLPLCMTACDYGENIGIFSLLFSYPKHLPFMVIWASSLGIAKWTLMGIILLLAIVAIYGWVKKS